MLTSREARKEILKKKFGRGAVGKFAGRTRRSLGHVSQVLDCERTGRRDEVVEKALARIAGLDRFEAFPPIEAPASEAIA